MSTSMSQLEEVECKETRFLTGHNQAIIAGYWVPSALYHTVRAHPFAALA